MSPPRQPVGNYRLGPRHIVWTSVGLWHSEPEPSLTAVEEEWVSTPREGDVCLGQVTGDRTLETAAGSASVTQLTPAGVIPSLDDRRPSLDHQRLPQLKHGPT